ncbi:MAG: disulfide bond formation protein B [Halioglobus sp.]|nr:disulfide bond formation protein B [Halioglobus sp.]
MTGISARYLNLTGALACAAMMAYALYAQYQLLLTPCPMCVFQRIATVSLGVVFLLAAAQNPSGWGRRVYALCILLAAGGGLGVAGWHVWMQNLPPDKVPACGPGFDYIIDAFPLLDALKLIFSGSGECAEIDWMFLGLSMPAWVAICFAGLLAYGLWANLRQYRPTNILA